MTRTYKYDELKPQPILKALVRPCIIRFGTRLNVFTETLIGRVKKAIHLKLQPDNNNRDSEIEFPEPWKPHDQTTAADW